MSCLAERERLMDTKHSYSISPVLGSILLTTQTFIGTPNSDHKPLRSRTYWICRICAGSSGVSSVIVCSVSASRYSRRIS